MNPGDIDFYKTIVKAIDFNSFSVYCAFAGLKFIGFIGVSDGKIEMLFIDPEWIGKGVGKTLVEFAIYELRATSVDVNEGNLQALEFYSRFGFEVYNRLEKDNEGKDYPILQMKL
ncbi:MAG: GNAT family N-acetyltransferase [Chitinophagaceae bacterium]|nr:GNAT family N-acetyltransferase [Chitinophagaceae bacterium]